MYYSCLQFSFDGYISLGSNFSHPFPESSPTLPPASDSPPLIVPLWNMEHPADVSSEKFLYFRLVEKDHVEFDVIARKIAGFNITGFDPDFVIIATWYLDSGYLVSLYTIEVYVIQGKCIFFPFSSPHSSV